MRHRIIKKAIHAPNYLNEPIEYNKSFSRGIKIKLGKTILLFISGTASLNHKGETCQAGNFSAQAKRTFDNLTALLKSEGIDWHDVIQTRCYLKKMKYYKKFNEFRNQFYKKQGLNLFPASICIEANLCRPNLLVEIELIAISKATK